ncbi:hypothetical protein B0H13DRAFT_1888832 [Mycena leptocephala]|nr:hypothetical protein B0H13DRAFT_1888832 [Mycena leptocephala]
MVNRTGKNGQTEQNYPEDSVLLDAFTWYARENSGSGLGTEAQLARLWTKFKLRIGKTKIYALRARLGVETVKNSSAKRTKEETRQAVMDLKQNNVIRRDSLQEILHNEFDEEFETRFVGKKQTQKHRTPLNALGPWHQEHSDGHEKLSEQGLDIGAGIHLPIYGTKDQWSSFLHALLLMPNVWTRTAIAHYYLDLVESHDLAVIVTISMQMTTDRGSEVNEAHKIHERLRDEVAPELTRPSFLTVLSSRAQTTHRYKAFGAGSEMEMGTVLKQFCQSFPILIRESSQTFYWLWVPLIQHGIDEFCEYWNNHTLQKSKGKHNAFGSSPKNMLINLTSIIATARDCSIRVNPETVYQLREAYGGEEAREAAFRFISREFEAEADGVYVDLGCPQITLPTAWSVFQQVVEELERRAVITYIRTEKNTSASSYHQ